MSSSLARTTVQLGWILVASCCCYQSVLADSAQVLPQGRSGVFTSYYDYFNIDQRYDDNGDKEDLSKDFNTSLDSTVFPLLK